MVMEAPPSPQSVGREFVRQYYTLLNKAPNHLHRFYNNQSSFLHGGLETNRETSPVIGQKQIHQKIQQLNFRDCHAKITQVDSQSTLGNGVVVQVSGELSNAGQPMRRFTQTFVLAAQSPKKYYVHNDIFRYQDEIISDEECDVDPRSDVEEEVTERPSLGEVPQQINQPVPQYYNPPNAPVPSVVPQLPHHHNQQPPPHVLNQPIPTVNGHPEDLNVLQGQVPSHVAPVQVQNLSGSLPSLPPQGLVQTPINNTPVQVEEQPQVQEEQEPEPLDAVCYNDAPEDEPEHDNSAEPTSNEPKTYANLLKSGSTVPYNSTNSAPACSVPLGQVGSVSPPAQNQAQFPRTNNGNNRLSGPGPRIHQQQQPKPQQGRLDSNRGMPGRNSIVEDGVDDRRRPQGMSANNDVNQLFLGNLPHSATEEELRVIFGEFGTIVDLRIHSKPAVKAGPAGPRAPANFGFITYETQQGVFNCLKAKVYYPKDDKSGTVINVEEKKFKDRPQYGGNRPSTDNRNRGDNGGQRRGPGGSGGPNRANVGGPGGPSGPNNRNTNYNRGGPPNRGPNTYNRR